MRGGAQSQKQLECVTSSPGGRDGCGEVGPGGGECQYEETDLEIFSLFTPTLSSVTHLLHHGQCGTVGGGCQDVSLYSRSGQTLVITPPSNTVIVTCNCQPSLYSCAAREVIILDNGKHTQTSLTTRNATIYTLRYAIYT